jgi:hypothetical protein
MARTSKPDGNGPTAGYDTITDAAAAVGGPSGQGGAFTLDLATGRVHAVDSLTGPTANPAGISDTGYGPGQAGGGTVGEYGAPAKPQHGNRE